MKSRTAGSRYIEVFYNRQRRHTSIDGIPPVTFESRRAEALGLAA
jgi:transposase InsO family protein